jgi:hypothetical protein
VANTARRTGGASLPLVLRWQSPESPLPLRPVRQPPRTRPRPAGPHAAAWLPTGPADRPFDFCGHMRRL